MPTERDGLLELRRASLAATEVRQRFKRCAENPRTETADPPQHGDGYQFSASKREARLRERIHACSVTIDVPLVVGRILSGSCQVQPDVYRDLDPAVLTRPGGLGTELSGAHLAVLRRSLPASRQRWIPDVSISVLVSWAGSFRSRRARIRCHAG